MSSPDEGRIVFDDVTKTFGEKDAATAALRNVSLEIAPGKIFGVIGYSGAGKSTLIRTVNGLEQPTSGRVMVEGVDMGALRGRAAPSDAFAIEPSTAGSSRWLPDTPSDAAGTVAGRRLLPGFARHRQVGPRRD